MRGACTVALRLQARSLVRRWARGLSDGITYDAGSTDVEALIEDSLDKTTFRRREDESPFRLLTTRREALALYREIWRTTALFDWPDQNGRLWRDVLRESARAEFEAARYEDDPEILNRLLVVGRDAVHRVAEQFLAKRQQLAADAEAAFRAGGGGGLGGGGFGSGFGGPGSGMGSPGGGLPFPPGSR
ncbi:complex 1 family LVR family (ISS) [Chlorella sorokiniana]|uniref:Complex 1 family LVR family (ISS) n=1 Tax=Chlorella sorokiniana TaxID=3076 RepID=A0A2P6TSC4_CHLSO|nr:complex 1 family LVR family (ISS) [Chlorella sorokiniana]|eukprot:PRW56965.1 complex 1 family LVR family (ISS) [Chlorella sorokiniana]